MPLFKEWTLIISISIIGVSILEMITINEKMNKIINLVLGLFLLCSILAPIKNFKVNDKVFNWEMKNSIKNNDLYTLVNEQGKDLFKNNIKILIHNTLKKENIFVQRIKIFMDTTEDNCILINKTEIYIDKTLENRKEEIKSLLKKIFEINADIIIVGCD